MWPSGVQAPGRAPAEIKFDDAQTLKKNLASGERIASNEARKVRHYTLRAVPPQEVVQRLWPCIVGGVAQWLGHRS